MLSLPGDAGLPPDPGPVLGGAPAFSGGFPAQLQQPQPEPPSDPLAALQDAIHSVTAAMQALPSPQDTQDAAQALLQLSRIQTRLMQSASPQG